MAVLSAQEPSAEANGATLDTLWLEITRACNWECVHCYAESGPQAPLEGSLQESDWQVLIREASRMDCRILHFIGGEPTLHPGFRRLLDCALETGFPSIEVNTNGSRISPDLARYMAGNRVGASVSFYSATPQRHDAITRRSGSFARTLRGIKRLLDNDVPTRVGVIEIDQTAEELDEARALLRSIGVQGIGGDHLRQLGRARQAGHLDQAGNIQEMSELCNMCSEERLCATGENEVFACPMSRSWPLGRARDGLGSALTSIAAENFRRDHRRTHPAAADPRSWKSRRQACEPDEDRDPSHCRPEFCSPNLCYPCYPGVCGPGP